MFQNKNRFKIVSLVFVFFASGIFYPCVTNADIGDVGDVEEIYIDFSEVEMGSTGTRLLHIANQTRYPLTFTLSFGTCFCGTPFSVATPSLEITGFTTASVEVYFTPSSPGPCLTMLYVFYGDNSIEELEVTGTGIEATTNEMDIYDLLNFFDDAVEAGDLIGKEPGKSVNKRLTSKGPGKSADNRLKAMRNMIRVVVDLVKNEDLIEACEKLQAIYKKIDGLDRPQDFVEGDAVSTLRDNAKLVMEGIGCK